MAAEQSLVHLLVVWHPHSLPCSACSTVESRASWQPLAHTGKGGCRPGSHLPSHPREAVAGTQLTKAARMVAACLQRELSGPSVTLLCGYVTRTIGTACKMRWPQRPLNEVVIAFEGKE